MFGLLLIVVGGPSVIVRLGGLVLLVLGLVAFVPVLQWSADGVSARNLVRRRSWGWSDIEKVLLGRRGLLFTRAMGHSQLIIRDAEGEFPATATTAISPTRADLILDAFERRGVPIGDRVSASRFPRTHPKVAMEESTAADVGERERQKETYRRLDEYRHHKD